MGQVRKQAFIKSCVAYNAVSKENPKFLFTYNSSLLKVDLTYLFSCQALLVPTHSFLTT